MISYNIPIGTSRDTERLAPGTSGRGRVVSLSRSVMSYYATSIHLVLLETRYLVSARVTASSQVAAGSRTPPPVVLTFMLYYTVKR